MANIPHLTLAQPRAVEAGPSEESKHCPALRDGGKENKGKEETFFKWVWKLVNSPNQNMFTLSH